MPCFVKSYRLQRVKLYFYNNLKILTILVSTIESNITRNETSNNGDGSSCTSSKSTATTILNSNVIKLLTNVQVVHPRCHIIWNVIITFLTSAPTVTTNNASTNTATTSTLMKKILEKNIPRIPNNNTSFRIYCKVLSMMLFYPFFWDMLILTQQMQQLLHQHLQLQL